MITFTEEHQDIRDMVAEFAANELAPRAEAIDEERRFPREAFAQLGELGLVGATVPEEHGGIGSDTLTLALVLEELARGCGSTAFSVWNHSVATVGIVDHASDEQRSRWLPALAEGERVASLALVEPAVGGDPGLVATVARREGDHYVLDGVKCAVAAAADAGLFLVVARTSPADEPARVGMFVIEGGAEAEGVEVTRVLDTIGLRGAGFGDLAFTDCRVPASALVGGTEDNCDAVAQLRDAARIWVASLSTGLARSATEYALRYASERQAFGRTIDQFPALQLMFAGAEAGYVGAQLLAYRAASLRDSNGKCSRLAAIARFVASQSAYRATKDAVQVLGGNGYSREYPVERMYRDVAALSVVDGSTDDHQLELARMMIGAD